MLHYVHQLGTSLLCLQVVHSGFITAFFAAASAAAAGNEVDKSSVTELKKAKLHPGKPKQRFERC